MTDTLWRTSPEKRIGNPNENWVLTRKKSWFLGREEEGRPFPCFSLSLSARERREERETRSRMRLSALQQSPQTRRFPSLMPACPTASGERFQRSLTSGTKRNRIRKIKTHMWRNLCAAPRSSKPANIRTNR